MSRSLLVSVLLATLVVLLCLSSTARAQSSGPVAPGGCEETFLDLYSIVSYANPSVNTSDVVFQITTEPGVDVYNVTLPTTYLLSEIYLEVGVSFVAVDATFTVEVNGQTQQLNGVSVFNASSGGTFVLSATFYQEGLRSWTNIVIINFTNSDCQYTDTFYITNPVPLLDASSSSGGSSGLSGDSSSAAGTSVPASTGDAGVRGDPQFVGLRGQSFQVHGMDGAVYALISDPHVQLNTRFVFLQGPRPCPVMPSTGKQATTCWSHAGSYLGELAVKTSAGDRVHIVAGSAETGFSSVSMNLQPVKLESSSSLHYLNTNVPSGSLVYNNTHELTLVCSYFTLTVENIDGFLNIRSLAVLDGAWQRLAAHGLLGQTWQWKRYSGKVKEIEGEVDDYVIDDDQLFGESFLFSRFESESHMQ